MENEAVKNGHLKYHDLEIIIQDWGVYIKSNSAFILNADKLAERVTYIMDICSENNKRNILYETDDKQVTSSVVTIYWAIKLMLKQKALGFKVAVIVPEIVFRSERCHFAETAAMNRSIFLKYFMAKDDAIHWLIYDGNGQWN